MARCSVVTVVEHLDQFAPLMQMHMPQLTQQDLILPHTNGGSVETKDFISNETLSFLASFQTFQMDAQLHSFATRLASARLLHTARCRQDKTRCTEKCSVDVSEEELE